MMTNSFYRSLVNTVVLVHTTNLLGERVTIEKVRRVGSNTEFIDDIETQVLSLYNDRVRLLVAITGYLYAQEKEMQSVYSRELLHRRLINNSSLQIITGLEHKERLVDTYIQAVKEVWQNKLRDKNSEHYREVLSYVIKKYLPLSRFSQLKIVYDFK